MRNRISPFRVEAAQAADEEAWRALWRAYCDFYGVSIQPAVTDVLWRRIADPNAQVKALICKTNSLGGAGAEAVGFANYVLHDYTWGTEQICYLEDLFVEQRARGRGAGTALINELIRLARENGWPRLYWHTHESNEVARSLYESFTPVDPFVRYLIKVE